MAFDGPLGTILGFGTSGTSRNLILLVVLAFAIVFVPFLDVRWVVDVTLALVLISCVRAISVKRRIAIIAWSLAAGPLIALLALEVLPPWVDVAARSLVVPFFVYTVLVLLIQLMKARRAGPEELYGASSTYLLLGLTWGVIFVVVETIQPGSFRFPDGDQASAESLLYFSYVTLVTLGYGEITPVSDVARSLSISEAIAGALFLTILVARLVGLYTTAQAEEAEKESGRESIDA